MTNGTVADPNSVPTVVDALAAVKIAIQEGSITPERVIELLNVRKKQKGRKVPELPPFTFPDSGYTVRVRKIGPWTLDQIRLGLRKLRVEPPVPVLEVEDGEYPNGQPRFRKETNPADPDYKQAIEDYNDWLNQAAGYRLLDIVMSSCVVADPADVDLVEVAAQRRGLLMAGPQPEEDEVEAEKHRKKIEAMPDAEVFVRCICLSTPRDTTELQSFVTSQSMPTEEGIQEQVETFRPEIQGETDLRGPDYPLGV